MSDLPEWARRLDLSPHPEGGWFRETWRAGAEVEHTVRSAELWLYHSGGPLLLEVGAEQHSATTHLLGADITAGESPQYVVPPGYWQRAVPRDDEPCLVSCVVVPGFDFADFVLGASTD